MANPIKPGTVWLMPDGVHYLPTNAYPGSPSVGLTPAKYDTDTGEWHRTCPLPVTHIDWATLLTTGTPIPPEPLRDPRITRLAHLLEPVLAELPADQADPIRKALDDVKRLPDEARRNASRAMIADRRNTSASARRASRRR